MTICYFRADGVACFKGELWVSGSDQILGGRMMVEGEPIDCPACGGTGCVPTAAGRRIMEFLETFARPMLREIVKEVLEQGR